MMPKQVARLRDDSSIVVRAPEDMVRMLMALPPHWRTTAFADDAHTHAADAGDADEALFWSEVLLLLQACDDAGVAVPPSETVG